MKEPASAYTQGGLIALVIGIVIGIAVGWWLCSERNTREEQPAEQPTYKVVLPEPAKPDTVVKHIVRRLPMAQPGIVAKPDGTETANVDSLRHQKLTAADEKLIAYVDSTDVVIPITQRVYEDSTRYRAVIEGYEPRLISLEIYPQRTKPPAAKRWRIGIQAGYGYTPKGLQPYVGIGISCKLVDL